MMKKTIMILFMMLFGIITYGCQREVDPELVALQTQYDNYRSNEFSEFDQFASYMTNFTYETSHAGVMISVDYQQLGHITETYEAFGIIIDEDESSYYAITDQYVLNGTAFLFNIFIEDVYGTTSLGHVSSVDETLGVAIIRFSKPIKPLFVANLATMLPFDDESVVLLSRLNDIKFQTTFGRFQHNNTEYYFSTNISLNQGALGGGVFDVNQHLVGIIVLVDEGKLVTFSDISALLD